MVPSSSADIIITCVALMFPREKKMLVKQIELSPWANSGSYDWLFLHTAGISELGVTKNNFKGITLRIAGFQCQNRSKNKPKQFNWWIKSRIWKNIDDNMQRLRQDSGYSSFWLKQDMRRNQFFLPKFVEICINTPCWSPSRCAPTWRPETNRNICHWLLLQKCELISRGTKKH